MSQLSQNFFGVHITHCCVLHGCKYGEKDCPVVNGIAPQEYLCEECSENHEHVCLKTKTMPHKLTVSLTDMLSIFLEAKNFIVINSSTNYEIGEPIIIQAIIENEEHINSEINMACVHNGYHRNYKETVRQKIFFMMDNADYKFNTPLILVRKKINYIEKHGGLTIISI